jgi:hypothetical protein
MTAAPDVLRCFQQRAATAHFPQLGAETAELASPRHRVFVRVTHWIPALSYLVLAASGVAILPPPERSAHDATDFATQAE